MSAVEGTAWLVLAFGNDRTYGANTGYVEDHTKVYDFDNKVQNSTQVVPGSIMLIRDRAKLLGAARVADLTSKNGTKTIRRCPTCATTKWDERKTLEPRYKCRNGHVFDAPMTDEIPCIEYKAHFGTSYQPAVGALSAQALRNACPNYADQVSIQRLEMNLLGESLVAALPGIEALQNPSIAASSLVESTLDPFIPTNEDRRQTVLRQLKTRRGQGKFRAQLITRYGEQCLVTGCALVLLVEAAHISPYRGDEDNHAENGLLLRPDIHTLFDLDLLGIHPETLEVHVHPGLSKTEYGDLVGKRLRCDKTRPSIDALRSRWEAFATRCELELV